MLLSETKKGYYNGPYKAMPLVGGRALPTQVVRQQRPDGTWKFHICRDGGWLKDGDAPNDCIDMDQESALILARIQDIAYAGAIMRPSGQFLSARGIKLQLAAVHTPHQVRAVEIERNKEPTSRPPPRKR